jgi:hypothetical protein
LPMSGYDLTNGLNSSANGKSNFIMYPKSLQS